jgi:hypothetical protein
LFAATSASLVLFVALLVHVETLPYMTPSVYDMNKLCGAESADLADQANVADVSQVLLLAATRFLFLKLKVPNKL